jgi:predicted MFS family arabinose efflux permease
MALFYFAPGLYTATFYKQQNDLGLNTQTQGFLTLLSGVGGIGASLLYGLVCRRFRLRTLLVVCLLAGTAANMGYLFYTSLWNAEIVETFNGFGYILAELALMDLAVRATPPGCEGMSFSLMMSVRNIGILGMDPAGSALLDHHIVNFNGLVIVNGLTTLAAVPLVFLLPRLLVRAKDAEAPSEPAAPRPDVQA